jgi:hypothetical protein
MERAAALIVFVVGCSGGVRSRAPCEPAGQTACGPCTQPSQLSKAGQARAEEAAQEALLKAEWERGLLTGYPPRADQRRFYSTDVGGLALGDEVAIAESPGDPAEQSLARTDHVYVFHFDLTTRGFSGRDGVLLDSRTITRTWIADENRMNEESFDANFCVLALGDGKFKIVQVGSELWPHPLH